MRDVNGDGYLLREVAAAAGLPAPLLEGRVVPAVALAAEAGIEERAVFPVERRGSGVLHPFPVGVVATTGGVSRNAPAIIVDQKWPWPSPEE